MVEEELSVNVAPVPLLSICIATLERASMLEAMLSALLPQLTAAMELVVVDGGSTDGTDAVVRRFSERFKATRYYFHDDRGGLDKDYDRAVSYASGTYCWLLTDDDEVLPGRLEALCNVIEQSPNLVVLNTEVRDEALDRMLQRTRFPEPLGASYPRPTDDAFLADMGDTLSFIGAVVIRRELWMMRNAERFYGSMFGHVGVILQSPAIERVEVMTAPVLALRYGNASWSSRYFEIWAFLWPDMIWQFDHYSVDARAQVTARSPWTSPLYLLKQRGRGAYCMDQYRKLIGRQPFSLARVAALLIALCPGLLVNVAAVGYLALAAPSRKLGMYDLLRSPHSSTLSRWIGGRFLR